MDRIGRFVPALGTVFSDEYFVFSVLDSSSSCSFSAGETEVLFCIRPGLSRDFDNKRISGTRGIGY